MHALIRRTFPLKCEERDPFKLRTRAAHSKPGWPHCQRTGGPLSMADTIHYKTRHSGRGGPTLLEHVSLSSPCNSITPNAS